MSSPPNPQHKQNNDLQIPESYFTQGRIVSKSKTETETNSSEFSNDLTASPMPPAAKHTESSVVFGITFYALCSSSMLFFNKLSVVNTGAHALQPGPISCIQLAFAVVFCFALWLARAEPFDDLGNIQTLKMYTIYCVLFVG
jgi:hypothetical protein